MNKLMTSCVAVLAGSLAVGGVLVAQQGNAPGAAPAAAAVDPGKVVLKVGESQMTAGQFEDFVASLPKEVQQMAKGPAKRRVAEDLVKLKLLAAEGKKQGLDQTPRFKQQMELMRDNALAGALIAELQGKLVTDAEVQKYYDAHKADYERVTARHILIATGGEKAISEEAAKAKADEIKKKLDGGADFAALAKAESADPGSKEDGGLLQAFGHGQMVPEFEQAAFTQKEGAVTVPVKTRYGYHVIKTEKKEVAPLAEVKDEIMEQLRPQKLEGLIDDLKKQANPVLDEAFFGPAAAAAGGEGGAAPAAK